MATKNKLAVAETFLSIQGEGHTTGAHSYFLRLAGCNLMCGGQGTQKDGQLHDGATWRCDSIEVWMKGKSMSFDEVLMMLGDNKFITNVALGSHLVITGGEPLMQQEMLTEFLTWLREEHYCFPICEIETNGTIMPNVLLRRYIQYWNVSPKLSNSGMSKHLRLLPEVLETLAFGTFVKNAMFKFVISSEDDFDEISEDFLLHVQRKQVWLMPAAETREELIKVSETVAQIAIREGFSFSSRLQVVIWDKATGV